MRKFLFILILIPAFLSLGHDIYIYSQDQKNGFRLSDLGALWDKYHKESHNQWKIKIGELGETISDLAPETKELAKETKNNEAYTKSFTQTDADNKETLVTSLKNQDFVQKNTNKLQKNVGIVLEQKALFIFSGLAAFIYLMNLILSRIFREKTSADELKKIKKKKAKDGGYQYSRK